MIRFVITRLFQPLGALPQPWRVGLSATLIVGSIVSVSMAMGYRIAAERTLKRETALAQAIGLRLGSIVSVAQREGAHLAPLAGASCGSILASLDAGDQVAQYVRNAFFVDGGQIYCSTVTGASVIAVPAYLTRAYGPTRIVMHAASPLLPHQPAMTIYERLPGQRGIGLVVPGAYLQGVLASAELAGAASAQARDRDGNALSSDGRLLSSAPRETDGARYVAPQALFSVSVAGGAAWRRQDVVDVEGAALFLGLVLGLTSAAGYVVCCRPGLRLNRQVRRGLARGEFTVVYQPIVDLATGQWVGAEALVRWQHPRRGLVMPGQFIGEVERGPLIADLTRFVLRRALAELGAMDLPDGFRLSINLAAFHAGLRAFPADLTDILAASQSRLQVVLEITERGLLAGIGEVRDSLDRLRQQGVRFAVDDFGTEHSNLALLRRFRFDYLKIDRQFIRGVVADDYMLVEAMTFLAAKIGAQVIAEGVEDAAQQMVLLRMGVPLAQGFLFGRPCGATEFARGYAKAQE